MQNSAVPLPNQRISDQIGMEVIRRVSGNLLIVSEFTIDIQNRIEIKITGLIGLPDDQQSTVSRKMRCYRFL